MTIASALTALNQDITAARTAITSKGGTVTSGGGSSQLATDIATIPTGGTPTLITKSITANGTYNASSDNADGYSSVTVNVSASKYGATIDNLLGNIDSNGKLKMPSVSANLVFTGVEDINNIALYYKFYRNQGIEQVDFPDLINISGNSACYYAFYFTNVTSASFPKLTTISGLYACSYMFSNSYKLTTVSVPELTTINGERACEQMLSFCAYLISVSFPKLATISSNGACSNMFSGCKRLTDVYYNALTTSSFGSYTNQFNSMLSSTGTTVTHTLHFPSNLQSTISGLSGYPLFGGTSGYVTLSFDLPATS